MGHRYSFGDVAMFRNSRLEKQAQATCVPRSKRFIMPLMFGNEIPNPPLKKKGAVAENITADYSLLAAAEYISTTKDSVNIRLIFWYSKARDIAEAGASTAASPLSKGLIRQTAQSIVRNSRFTLNHKPIFDNENEDWRSVPDALVRGSLETSSYHLILHAWAYMLDIPIQAGHTREVNTMDDVLYTTTLEIINLALKGSLDTDTIRCFLLESGYAAEGLGPRLSQVDTEERAKEQRSMKNFRAFLMNEVVFDKIVADLRSDKHSIQIRAKGIPRPGVELFEETEDEEQELETKGQLKSQIKAIAKQISKDLGEKIDDNANALKREIKKQRKDIIEAAAPSVSLKQQLADARNWTERFRISHEDFRRQWRAAGKKPFTSLDGWPQYNKVIGNDDVFSAIGSIWWALWQKGRRFSLPTQQACQWNRRAEGIAEGHRAIAGSGAQYPLILPLFCDYGDLQLPPRKTREEMHRKLSLTGNVLSHYIVLIAEPPEDPHKTAADYEGTGIRGLIRVEARGRNPDIQKLEPIANDAMNCIGWLDFNPETNHAIQTDRVFRLVEPRAKIEHEEFDNGAMHAILTTWAYMLGLSRDSSTRRRGTNAKESTEEFYTKGFEVIECVIAGLYDTQTIQAFFHAFGFIDYQNFPEQTLDIQASAVEMSPAILEVIIGDILDQEQTERLSKVERVKV